MTYEIRTLGASESGLAAAVRALRAEAFGAPAQSDEPDCSQPTTWGAFTHQGDLAAVADEHSFLSSFGGAPLPTAGVGGVAVPPEHRGRGVAMRLLRAVIVGAREDGAVISTLFGAAPALYRRLGYGMLAHSYQWRLPVAKLAGIRPSPKHTLTRAGAGDHPEMAALYTELAAAGTGMAHDAGLAAGTDAASFGHTIARDEAGGLVGYCTWRTVREGTQLLLEVRAIHAIDADAYRTLVASLGTWGSTVDVVALTTVDSAPVWASIPGVHAPVGDAPYMLRVLDPARAVAARRWNPAVSGTADLALRDPVLDDNTGSWRLTASAGVARLEKVASAAATSLTAEGFALWFAGVATCAELRAQGHLEGPVSTGEAMMDAMAAQPKPTVTHYF